ncbi:Lrp/AsnC family transcriptional regulator [Paenibacillus sp. sgz500958]|uniref:Lrp/AsnC family transcriptional regulator n=1 Tax=Paenibacillus sp. sgz500958 TaxID=3242475 RepID=UPI0036D3D082
MNQMLIDDVDYRILQLLIQDSTLSNKDIGEQVHMTGQAVGARIRKMRDTGVIEGYSVLWNPEKLGLSVHAFVTVFLSSNSAHQSFRQFVMSEPQVAEVHRVSGEGCYWMRIRTEDQGKLSEVLDRLLQFGNYKVSLAIGTIK